MKKISLALATLTIFSVLFITSCKKTDPITECVKYFDVNGQAIGSEGDCTGDEDWGFIALTDKEQGYLDFQDNVSLTGTQMVDDLLGLQAYPIPAAINQTLSFLLVTTEINKTVKVKMAIIDENQNVIDEFALLRVTQIPLQINLADSRYSAGSYYRVYYQISADGNPNFFEGYGDFLVE